MISTGIDLGDRSCAVAAVELDDEGIPLRLRALSLMLHDGGVIDEQYKVSRLAKRGNARRTRHRYARNKRRPNAVRDALRKSGFPAPEFDELPPHPSDETVSTLDGTVVMAHLYDARFPFYARQALLEPIDDQNAARLLFACAVLHIDRHRGWRNPWQSLDSLLRSTHDEAGAPQLSPGAARWLLAVGDRYGGQVRTYGEAAALAISNGHAVRPNKRALTKLGIDVRGANIRFRKAKAPEDLAELTGQFALPIRPFQQDLLYELLLIAETQGFDDDAINQIVRAVFWQERPGFAPNAIGDCPLETNPKQRKRAAGFLPSVQEWKIRGFVANLRVKPDGSKDVPRRLTAEEADHLVNNLSSAKERGKVRWGTIEDWLSEFVNAPTKINRNERDRVAEESGSEDQDETSVESSRHPIVDSTNALVLKGGADWKTFRAWWTTATNADREMLLRSLDPASRDDASDAFRDSLLEQDAFDSEDFETFVEKLPSSRVAYSSAAIEKMLPFLRSGKDLYEARKEAFGLDETWTPPGVKWDAPRMNHPVLQVVRSTLNKSLGAIDREIGIADFVRVEAARRSMSIMTERRNMSGYARENEARNLAAREAIEANGEKPSRGRARAARIIADQNCQCAYGIACNGRATLGIDSAEIDHIIPRAQGAGNPRRNMVAVCRECNRKKGGRTLANAATTEQLEAAILRMQAWQMQNFSPDLPREMERLMRAESAGEVDLRSATPTSQVSTQMCNMLKDRYQGLGNGTVCESVNAAVGAEARKSAGFDKKRVDHRHHIVDAVITATINTKVIPFLRERQAIRDFARTFKKDSKRRKELKASAEAFGLDKDYFNRWMAGLTSVINDVKELLAVDGEPPTPNGAGSVDPISGLDVVAPRRPIRLKAASRASSNGDGILIAADPLHEETADKLLSKRFGSTWNKDEIYRVADRDLHLHLRRALREPKKKLLPEDDDRTFFSGDTELTANDSIALTPRVPQVVVRNAAFAIGSVHHLRVYEFDDGSGPRRAFLPVYRYDVVCALRDTNDPSADRRATHVRLHRGAISFRAAKTSGAGKLIKHLDSGGSARQVAWIAPGDEILLDSHGLVREATSGSAPSHWLSERRFYCTGLEANYINVRPLLVGANESDENVSAVKLRVSLANAMDKLVVIRRDSLGRVKTAWRPQE